MMMGTRGLVVRATDRGNLRVRKEKQVGFVLAAQDPGNLFDAFAGFHGDF
jgi:hypothetical protein